MKIIIDAMGGDDAPRATVEGALMAAGEFGVEVLLVGRQKEITQILGGQAQALYQKVKDSVRIIGAEEVVDMHDDPATVLRQKKNSSMAVGLSMLAQGEGDAFISAGSTGALLSGSTLIAKRIKGIRRGALAPILPTKTGKVLLIDAGANTECTAEYLLQFGFMGSYYMEKMLGIEKPRVGLVNNGSEDSKGDALRLQAYGLLQKAHEEGRINFVGNVEGRDVPLGACDVAVCDGFTGNVLLKTVEGVASFFSGMIKELFTQSARTKAAYLLVKPGLSEFKKVMNYKETGGAPFLGISRAVIKAHGSSDAYAIRSAVKQAVDYAGSGIISDISDNITHMTVSSGEK